MVAVVFPILFIISCVLFPCQGKVFPPTNADNLVFLPGSTARIVWTFNDTLGTGSFRSWTFIPSDGGPETLGRIVGAAGDFEKITKMFDVAADKPATLILSNVNQTYDGKYRFNLVADTGNGESEVTVFIATKPVAQVSASNTNVDEGENVTLSCTSKDGNPPANLTWTKDGNKIGETKKGQNIWFLENVSAEDQGIYECTAESYPDEKYRDTKAVKVIVIPNSKPNETDLEFSRNPAIIGKEVTIKCRSEGQPKPSFTIIHNGTTKITGIEEPHTIQKVNWDDAGNYTCVAINKLGSNLSKTKMLNVTVEGLTTPPTSTSVSSSKGPGPGITDDGDSGGIGVGGIVGIVIGVLVLVVVIIGVVYYCKSKQRNGYKGNANVKPGDNGSEDAAENTYDTASGPSGSRTKPSKSDAPVVYSAVDKENRQGRPLYATLDEAAMRAPNNRRTPEEERPEPTQYASIEFGKTDEVPKADLV